MKQVRNGKAFEHALAREISRHTNADIVQNKAYFQTKIHYEDLPERKGFDKAADEASIFLLCHDDQFSHISRIALQDDFQGKSGDVRDIVIYLEPDGSIGISAKHNHQGVKHSRLSDSIDFGKDWENHPCGSVYWRKVRPVFEDLRGRQGQYFRDIPDKVGTPCPYWPPLRMSYGDYARTTQSNSSVHSSSTWLGQKTITRLSAFRTVPALQA